MSVFRRAVNQRCDGSARLAANAPLTPEMLKSNRILPPQTAASDTGSPAILISFWDGPSLHFTAFKGNPHASMQFLCLFTLRRLGLTLTLTVYGGVGL